VTIEREIAEVVRGSYARSAGPPARRRIGARELFSEVLDPDSWRSWDTVLVDVPAGSEYLDQLTQARQTSGEDEAVVTGEGTILGRRVCVVACEFAFLGGTIGVAAAERLTLAIERATAERLPLVASRCQAARACKRGPSPSCRWSRCPGAHAASQGRLPYLVYLRHPTTGGCSPRGISRATDRSTAGSADRVPRAAGLRGALRSFLPEGVQVAENLYRLGLVDAVLVPADLAEIVARALDVMCTVPSEVPAAKTPPDEPIDDVPAWQSIEHTRRPERPGVEELLRAASHSVTILSGTQEGSAAAVSSWPWPSSGWRRAWS